MELPARCEGVAHDRPGCIDPRQVGIEGPRVVQFGGLRRSRTPCREVEVRTLEVAYCHAQTVALGEGGLRIVGVRKRLEAPIAVANKSAMFRARLRIRRAHYVSVVVNVVRREANDIRGKWNRLKGAVSSLRLECGGEGEQRAGK